jgi:hypothetical protein
LMSPIASSEKQLRALQEAFARLCECDPKSGYSKPTFSPKTFANVFYGGHTQPMFSNKSYFAFNTKPGQALADEVVALAASQPGSLTTSGTSQVYYVNMGRDIGMTRNLVNPAGPMVATRYIRMFVETNNCAGKWRSGEITTTYPDN